MNVSFKEARFFIILHSLIFFVSNAAPAATQGSLGVVSSGNVGIFLSLGDAAKISYVDDVVFGTWSGIDNLADNDDLCVYSNTAGGAYTINAVGNGPSGSFQLDNRSRQYLAYIVRWNDVAGTNSGSVNLSSGVDLTGQTGASTISVDCDGGTNLTARIRVGILSNDLDTAQSGNYSGIVIITITPQ